MTEQTNEQGKETTNPPGSEVGSNQPEDKFEKFSNELFTRFGRLGAETKKNVEGILTRLEQLEAKIPVVNQPTQDSNSPAMKELNDKLSERALSGDFFGAVDEALSTRKKAEEMLRIRNESQVDKAIQGMSEVKYFKEVQKDVMATAKTLVGQGYSPQDAVAFAYEKARADHLDKLVSHGTSNGESDSGNQNLDLLDGGSRAEDAGARKSKLNAEGKKAWEKNKNVKVNGQILFKDEADFIAQMSARVKERYVG